MIYGYRKTVEITQYEYWTVEAESEEEAEMLANDPAHDDEFTEAGDILEIRTLHIDEIEPI